MQAQSLGWEDPLKKEMLTHYSGFANWEIPRTEEPGGLSPWGHKGVEHCLVTIQQQMDSWQFCPKPT